LRPSSWRWAALKNGLQDEAAYRTEFFLQIVSSAAVPAGIQIILWYALFKLGGATHVGGMTYSDMIHYTVISVLFTQVRGGDHDFELQEMIRSGSLSNYLLKPVGVVEFIYIRGVAARLLIGAICLGVGMALAPFLGHSPTRMLGAMVLALMGNIIHYQLGAALATTAFLWEEAYSVLMVKNMVVSFLSGELIPLNLFPPSLNWIWQSTPFYLYVYGPTQYALGKWSHAELITHIVIAGAWMFAGWALVRLTWARGMRRYLSLGG
jgi:ABC-2 type transport system permease protein